MKRLWACVTGATLAYAVLAVVRHRTFRSTGFDLGIYDQVLWHFSRAETPESTLMGLPNQLGDHFTPIMILLAPLRWLGTEALLVAQAGLVCAAAVPIHAFARKRVGERGALWLAVAYLLFGGVQEALWFDLHEWSFEPLLLASAVWAADEGRLRASFACAAGLLLIKEDMALLVIALGAWYALMGHRRLGAATAALGAAWFVIVLKVVIPELRGGDYGHWTYDGSLIYEFWRWPEAAFSPSDKVKLLLFLFGSFLGLSLLSPLVILGAPLLAERLASTDPKHWTLEDHYSLTIAPVLVLAAADGLGRLAARPGRLGGWVAARRTWAAAAPAAIAVALVPAFPLARLLEPGFYAIPEPYRDAPAALDRIPQDASVYASNRLVPHLSGRHDIRLLEDDPPPGSWIVAAVDDESPEGAFPYRSPAAMREAVCERGAARLPCTGVVVIRR